MLTINDSSLVQLKAENIDLNDKIYLAKSGDIIGYSLKMSELIKKLKTDIIPTIKDYNVYSGVTGDRNGYYHINPNIQQKFGFSKTDTSQEFWDALANNVVRGNASRIQYGDIVYMPVTWNGWTETLWRVVDINRYSDHDLVFCPAIGGEVFDPNNNYYYPNDHAGGITFDYGEPYNIRWMTTGIVNYGTVYADRYGSKYYNNRIGWAGCGIRCAFNGVSFKSNNDYPNIEPDWIPQVPALSPTKTAGLNKIIDDACGGHLRKISRHLHMLSNPHISGSVDRDEEVVDYAFLPKEIELFGKYGYGVNDPLENGATVAENQFKYYRLIGKSSAVGSLEAMALQEPCSCTITANDNPHSTSNFKNDGDYWCVGYSWQGSSKQYAGTSGNMFPYWCFGTGN